MQSINEYCETLINAKRYEIMTEGFGSRIENLSSHDFKKKEISKDNDYERLKNLPGEKDIDESAINNSSIYKARIRFYEDPNTKKQFGMYTITTNTVSEFPMPATEDLKFNDGSTISKNNIYIGAYSYENDKMIGYAKYNNDTINKLSKYIISKDLSNKKIIFNGIPESVLKKIFKSNDISKIK